VAGRQWEVDWGWDWASAGSIRIRRRKRRRRRVMGFSWFVSRAIT
jgi:hypothetical protein